MNKKALLTGSTGGIGTEIAKRLAQDGWDLVLLNRNAELSAQQAADLSGRYPDQSFYSFQANLMDVDNLKAICVEILEAHPKISALYNVAGLLTDKHIKSEQGIEGHFAVNTLAPYSLTQLLGPALKAAATSSDPSSVVYFSSSAINSVKKLDVDQLIDPDQIGGLMGAYARSKAALNVMTCVQSTELKPDNVYVYCVDPGPTRTKMTDDNDGMPWILRKLAPLLFSDVVVQTDKLLNEVRSALHENLTGIYISNGKRKPQPAFANDDQTQHALHRLLNSLTVTTEA